MQGVWPLRATSSQLHALRCTCAAQVIHTLRMRCVRPLQAAMCTCAHQIATPCTSPCAAVFRNDALVCPCRHFADGKNSGHGSCKTDISWLHSALGIKKSLFSDAVANYVIRFHLDGACYRSTQVCSTAVLSLPLQVHCFHCRLSERRTVDSDRQIVASLTEHRGGFATFMHSMAWNRVTAVHLCGTAQRRCSFIKTVTSPCSRDSSLRCNATCNT
jgi:hypothetical protein